MYQLQQVAQDRHLYGHVRLEISAIEKLLIILYVNSNVSIGATLSVTYVW